MSTSDNDIAIVAVALRVPGANTPERFWQNLRDGVESVRSYSDDELREASVSGGELANPNYVRAGAPLEGMELFDAEFFGFGPKEAAIMDPQHRHFLECAWEALERSGHVPSRFEGAIGVFSGVGMGSYFAHNILTNRDLIESVGLFLLRHTGNDKDFLATRLSYCLNLHGPSVNVQTACSTSLVAVHLACQSLLSGECDMALAGGVTIEIPHRQGYLYHEGEILSPDGHCRPFDHRAEGTIFGSGTGVAVLRRLSDAIEAGDPVIAVIKGTAVNNDGSRKVGYLAPSVDGQAAAVVEALNLANVSADSIGMVECHGTGTAMGDPIEVAALTQAFTKSSQRNQYCAIGSVKSNIGHLDTAAGVVSLIKAALSLQNKQVPPSLNYEAPNPQIDFEHSPFFVNHQLRPWPAGAEPRRASVNSLGVGGTNAHIILEEAPPEAAAPSRKPAAEKADKSYVLALTARNKRSLAENQKRLAAHLREHPELGLADVAYSLWHTRQHFDVRRVLAARSREDALRLLEDDASQLVFTHTRRDRPSIVFMFPGGGAQYPRMAAGLSARDAVFKEHLERGLEMARGLGLDLRPLLAPSDDELAAAAQTLERPSLQLPLLFIVEYALAQSWIARGVTPAVLIGHSMGENTAACVAGVMTFQTALGLVALRGKLFETVPEGGMLSVPMPAAELAPLLTDGVVIACENAPSLCVASGPRAALDALVGTLAARSVEAQHIRIRIAAHSPMLEPILNDFGAYLKKAQLSPPRIPIVSNLTGELLTNEQATDPLYWVKHLRNTVKFERSVGTLEAEGNRIYLEVGPGRVLGSLVRQCVTDSNANPPITTLRHPDQVIDDETFMLTALGRLWASGAPVELAATLPVAGRRVALPTYAFDHKPYFIAPGKVVLERTSAMRRIADIADWFFRPIWRWRELEPEELSGPKGQTYLLFADELGIADGLAERLRARGHRAIFVRKSGAYGQTDVFEYEVAPHAPHSYSTLVQELMASEKLPDRILHLWSVDEGGSDPEVAWSYTPARRKAGFDSLFHLMHAFGSEGVTHTMHLTAVTTGALRLMSEPLPHPEKAMVSGICQVIPREAPSVSASWLDLPLPRRARSWLRSGMVDNLDGLVTCLESEAYSQRKSGTVAYRDGRRFERDFESAPRQHGAEPSQQPAAAGASTTVPANANADTAARPITAEFIPTKSVADGAQRPSLSLPPAAESGRSRLRDHGVYLITGGLGGIGLALARFLAQQYRARLLLIARTALPPSAQWDRFIAEHLPEHAVSRRIASVRELEGYGAQVEVVQADVANLTQMRDVFTRGRARFGRVHGMFHAAGVLDDELVALKSINEAEEVLRPKVEGTWVLHQLGLEANLELFVLFSSTSTLIGPPGQADYVAANAFMNAYADSRRGKPGPLTVAVQWGVWRDVGMAAEAARELSPKESAGAITKVQGPFFDTRRDTPDGSVILEGRHGAKQTWWLDDHRLADNTAVVPGTGYLQLMAVAAGVTGMRRPFEVRDAMFLRPLIVDEPRTIRVRARKLAGTETFEVQSSYEEQGVELGYVTHSLAELASVDDAPSAPLDLGAIRRRCAARVLDQQVSIRTAQEAHLRFGPRFRCLRKAYYGQGEALGELALDPELVGDVENTPLHAGLLDLGTGFAMELVPGYDATAGLWAPISYRRLRLHAPLPAQCVSWVRVATDSDARSAQGTIRFDIELCDTQGKRCVTVEQLTLRKVPAGQTLAQIPKPAANEIEKDSAAGGGTRAKATPSAAETLFQSNLEAGITPREGGPALELVLSGHVPSQIVVSSLDPRQLIRQMDESSMQQLPTSTRFARPELDTAYVAPTEPLHQELATVWEQILGIDGIGIRDSFFELGGHSLTAVRLSAEVRKRFEVELPLSALFEAPTIERLGGLLAKARVGTASAEKAHGTVSLGSREFSPVVPIKPKGSQRPLFCVAGQGGNPMHLRTLAHYLGPQRPFYGLQHRGLDGRSVPYASVEEMASDYIKHIVEIDSGPYMIAGYSGGGTAAFEMARQLRAAGKGVDAIMLFDSFCPLDPDPGLAWRIRGHLEALQSEGTEYARRRLLARLKRERQWIEQRFFKKAAPVAQSRSMFETAAANWQAIEARYRPLPFHGSAFLFRVDSHDPDDARYFAQRYGGWSRLLTLGVQSFTVPGTHVSMCEEPNVQVLAEKLREVLDELDATSRAAQ